MSKQHWGITVPSVRYLLALLSVLVVFAFARAVIHRSCFIRIGGVEYPRDSSQLSLRQTDLSVDEFDRISSALPNCRIDWMVPIQNQRIQQDATELVLDNPSEEDLIRLKYLPQLRQLKVLNCQNPDAMLRLAEKWPNLNLIYSVILGDQEISNQTTALTLEDGDLDSVRKALPHLENLRMLVFTGKLPNAEELMAFDEEYPQLDVKWTVTVGARNFNWNTRNLDFSGESLSKEMLCEIIPYFPLLRWADVTGCALTDGELRQLIDRFPEVLFRGELLLYSRLILTDAEELDISGTPLTDTAELEAALPYLKQLKKVDMCGCGLSNEEMDALNQRHEGIRFIWELRICTIKVRTDATGFIPWGADSYQINNATDEDIGQLRYCVDMISVDIGHMWGVTKCDWAAYMPNLQYLIMGESRVSDLSPLSGLKNLVWLEIFDIPVQDLSPLVECTGLEDLNLGGILCDPEPISRMTWLKNLWWFGVAGRSDVPARVAPDILPEALPNTNIVFYVKHATAGGWRRLPNYYKMRDALGMFYMD